MCSAVSGHAGHAREDRAHGHRWAAEAVARCVRSGAARLCGLGVLRLGAITRESSADVDLAGAGLRPTKVGAGPGLGVNGSASPASVVTRRPLRSIHML